MSWLKRKKTENKVVKSIAVVAFIVMVTCNAFANILPINGVNTGQVSDSYTNLFAPIGFTFSIWGVIYTLLACFCAYQFANVRGTRSKVTESTLESILPWFIASSVLNSIWIFAWHYDFIGASTVIISLILICLVRIAVLLSKEHYRLKDYSFVVLPFSVYVGWLTVAVIANVTTWLVAIEWGQFGLDGVLWTQLILVIGILIAVIAGRALRNIAYLFVIIWAYIGILAKQISESGFDGEYQTIITTLVLLLGVLMFVAYDTFTTNRSNRRLH